MTRLVDDLLDVSRITTGKLAIHKEQVELHAVVHGAIETSRPLIEQCGHELTVELEPGPMLLNGDTTRLAPGSLEFIEQRREVHRKPQRSRFASLPKAKAAEAVVSISDTGMGITPEMLPHVFEMSSRKAIAMLTDLTADWGSGSPW